MCKFGNIPANCSQDNMQTSTFWLKYSSSNLTVTLKIRSRSPKSNQLFNVSECCIHANLVKICRPIHEISCSQETITLTPTGSAPKTVCPTPLRWGDIMSLGNKQQLQILNLRWIVEPYEVQHSVVIWVHNSCAKGELLSQFLSTMPMKSLNH